MMVCASYLATNSLPLRFPVAQSAPAFAIARFMAAGTALLQ